MLFCVNPDDLDAVVGEKVVRGNANGSGSININDAVYLLNYLFQNGQQPPAPLGQLGTDPTADGLSCWDFVALMKELII